MKLLNIFILFVFLSAIPAFAAVQEEEIAYKHGDMSMKGYLVYDDSIKGERPGVIVVHEWWGHNDYSRKRARMLAELGYTAFALDMYGDGKNANHPEDAGKMSSAIMSNIPDAKARFEAAMKILQDHKTTDSDRIAAIGYCFGGAVAIVMGELGVDLDGVASFHGVLPGGAIANPEGVKAKFIIFHGEDDPFLSAEQVEAFKKAMSDAKADMRFISYVGAKHSFTVENAAEMGEKFDLPLVYNAKADKDSWAKLQAFLKEVFADEK